MSMWKQICYNGSILPLMSWPIVWTQIEHLDTSLRVITAYFVKSIEHLDTSMYVKHISV